VLPNSRRACSVLRRSCDGPRTRPRASGTKRCSTFTARAARKSRCIPTGVSDLRHFWERLTTRFTSPDGKTTESENKAGRTTSESPSVSRSYARCGSEWQEGESLRLWRSSSSVCCIRATSLAECSVLGSPAHGILFALRGVWPTISACLTLVSSPTSRRSFSCANRTPSSGKERPHVGERGDDSPSHAMGPH